MKLELTQEQVKALAQGVVPSELKQQAEAALPQSRVPDRWEALGRVRGWWINGHSSIQLLEQYVKSCFSDQIFATESQAKSALAAAQLSQLMKATNGDWVADWETQEEKYCIGRYENELEADSYSATYHFLAFPTPELRDEFMTKHEALIKTYFEL